VAQGLMGANRHTMPTTQAGHFSTGYKSGAFLFINFNDCGGTIGCTNSVFFAFFLIDD
jgi:hypothetical protein